MKACPPAPKTSSPRRRPWPVGAFPHGPRCPWVLCWSRRSWASVSPSLPKAFIQLFNPAFGTGVQATDAALNAVESTEGRTFSYVTFELQSGAFGATQPQLVTHPMNQATDSRMPSSALIPSFWCWDPLKNPTKAKRGGPFSPWLLGGHLEVHGYLWPRL